MSQPPQPSTPRASTTQPPIFSPNPAFLSSAHPPALRIPDLERSLLLEPGRWDAQTARLVLASHAPVSAVVPVLVTLEHVYAMQEMVIKQRKLDEGIEELNRVLEEERGKVVGRGM